MKENEYFKQNWLSINKMVAAVFERFATMQIAASLKEVGTRHPPSTQMQHLHQQQQ